MNNKMLLTLGAIIFSTLVGASAQAYEISLTANCYTSSGLLGEAEQEKSGMFGESTNWVCRPIGTSDCDSSFAAGHTCRTSGKLGVCVASSSPFASVEGRCEVLSTLPSPKF